LGSFPCPCPRSCPWRDPAPATVWLDDSADYTSNEVAINWNAPLIYALAAFLPAP